MKLWVFACIALMLFISCSNDTKSAAEKEVITDELIAEADTSGPDTAATEELPDNDNAGGFNPENPGYNIMFQIMTMDIFGQQQSGMAFGVFMKTAREDLIPAEETSVPVDTCEFRTAVTNTPTCATKEDCAPEQECVPDTDRDGKPVAGTEHCATPNRASLDMGPVTISGFAAGDQTFAFEPNDKIYKLNGTGDGSIDLALLAYGVPYTLNGAGKDDLGAFTGTMNFYQQLQLTAPEKQPGSGSIPLPSIPVELTKDTLFTWSGANPGGTIQMTISGKQGSVFCNLNDDGEYTVPLSLISQIQWGTGFEAMGNMFLIERKNSGTITGGNVTVGSFTAQQMINIMISPKAQ